MRNPDFTNILKVLNNKKPDRPTLFEFYLNQPLYEKLTASENIDIEDELGEYRLLIHAFKNAGYDYLTMGGSDFEFPAGFQEKKNTVSLNEGAVILDRKSFNQYRWPDPDQFDYSRLDRVAEELPDGMKVIVYGPRGVLENVMKLVGYEPLCYMLHENPSLVEDIINAIGSRLVRYYEICGKYEAVGAMISNDDWGFHTQTLLSHKDMKKYIFPWHKKIVGAIHNYDKPAILHSCGNLEGVMEDIIEDLNYDAKHSFEDKILPVEDAYEKWQERIAILGGIDVNFICDVTPEEVKERSRKMIERTERRGGYALGTGNSVPEYVPDENYLAMISVVEEKQ